MTAQTWQGLGDPPVIETVLSLEFAPLPAFGVLSLARIHESFAAEFPMVTEHEILPPTRPMSQGSGFEFFGAIVPQVRLWLASEDQALLVQAQHDRLTLNWRRVDETSPGPYPGFAELQSKFAGLVDRFVKELDLDGQIAPLVTEWTYVNRIDPGALADGGSVFTVWNEPDIGAASEPLLTRFQHVRAFRFDALGGNGQLEISAEPVAPGGGAPVSLTISAKCFHRPDTTVAAAMAAAAVGHDLARNAFVALTSDKARQAWGELS